MEIIAQSCTIRALNFFFTAPVTKGTVKLNFWRVNFDSKIRCQSRGGGVGGVTGY
jgi:hypothetical protein